MRGVEAVVGHSSQAPPFFGPAVISLAYNGTMSEGPKPRRRWYLVIGLLSGFALGSMFAPACGPVCTAKWAMSGAGLGLVAGVLFDAKSGRRR